MLREDLHAISLHPLQQPNRPLPLPALFTDASPSASEVPQSFRVAMLVPYSLLRNSASRTRHQAKSANLANVEHVSPTETENAVPHNILRSHSRRFHLVTGGDGGRKGNEVGCHTLGLHHFKHLQPTLDHFKPLKPEQDLQDKLSAVPRTAHTRNPLPGVFPAQVCVGSFLHGRSRTPATPSTHPTSRHSPGLSRAVKVFLAVLVAPHVQDARMQGFGLRVSSLGSRVYRARSPGRPSTSSAFSHCPPRAQALINEE
jgi:hypothetical protein